MMQNNNPQAIIKGLQLFDAASRQHADRAYAQAAQLYKQALALMPDHPKVLLGYGRLAEDVEDWRAAEQIFRRIGQLRPQSGFEGHLGHALYRLERFAEAVPLLEKYLQGDPANTEMLYALANSLCGCGRWEDGLAMARQACARNPDPRILDVMLNALHHLGRHEELGPLVDDALRRHPESREIRSLYSLHKLKSGDYRAGFRYFTDFRWRNNLKTPADAGTPGEWWDGKPFAGTLLVTAEQGLGDEIMVSSMFDDLVAMGQQALIECDARLIPVYERTWPTLRFVPRHQKKLAEAFRQDSVFRKVNGLDLAVFLRNDSGHFPARRAWLRPDAQRTAELRQQYRQRWPGKRLVGISWKSSRVLEGGALKNIELADFSPVFATPDCVFVNLQYGDVGADLARLRASGLADVFVDPGVDPTRDIDGLFAQVAALDAVVSSSNTTVHIAGALGVPCLVLLPRVRPVLWYWGYTATRTPWYPSLELWRNPVDNDWREVMQSVSMRLRALPEGAP